MFLEGPPGREEHRRPAFAGIFSMAEIAEEEQDMFISAALATRVKYFEGSLLYHRIPRDIHSQVEHPGDLRSVGIRRSRSFPARRGLLISIPGRTISSHLQAKRACPRRTQSDATRIVGNRETASRNRSAERHQVVSGRKIRHWR
jgi:hypothetical protein